MKGYRFYEELENKNRKAEKSLGTVVAAILREDGAFEWWSSHGVAVTDAIAATFNHPNSDVSTTAVSIEYLGEKCRRISEARAREIHPALFEYLEAGG